MRDIALGQARAVEALLSGFEGGIFNLAVGQPYTVLQVIAQAEKVSGRACPYSFAEAREGEVSVSYADAGRAAGALAWRAHYSLEDMARGEWQWYSR
ncbi:MAG TPA: hypothetical protein PLB38_01815 [bacterium]|nr:hypothetical protein [bacterium]